MIAVIHTARKNVMVTQSWVAALHTRIAAAIKQRRKHEHLTAEQLAAKTTELGYPITRSQIANYESGRRQSLDTAELLIIAHALDVPLLGLLFPGPIACAIELIPGETTSTATAIMRHSGDHHQHGPLIQIEAMVDGLDKLIGTAISGRGQLSTGTETYTAEGK
jgi:transcriptional regulator with XRE-family HTH domain